jgi:Fe-S cluster assembly protein SufD
MRHFFEAVQGQLDSQLDSRRIRKILDQLHLSAPLDQDFFATLCAARAHDGVVISVPDGVQIESPIRVVQQLRSGDDTYYSRLFVELGKGAKATIIQDISSDDATSAIQAKQPFMAVLNQVHVNAGARLEFIQCQTLNHRASLMVRQRFDLGESAELKVLPVFVGGARTQCRSEIMLNEAGAQCEVQGAVRGDGKQIFDFWAAVHHPAPQTQSRLDYWTVMADSGRAVFNGNVVIPPTGHGVVAKQSNKNMLLSHQAEIHSSPKLEISCDDVQCAHGASVSSVSEDQLIYLQSRGLTRAEAEEMVIGGFTAPVLEQIPHVALKERVEALLRRKSSSKQGSTSGETQ